jgi:signal peptidase I
MFGADSNPFLSQQNEKTTKDVLTDFIQTIVIAMAFSLLLYFVFLVPSIVDGTSMEPSYYDKELLFANKTVQWLGKTSLGERWDYDYKRGDVIIFKHNNTNIIKRIIATEGDTVKISDGKVYVNNKQIKEDYLKPDTYTRVAPAVTANIAEHETLLVPKNSYFILGDNRIVSKDSRYREIGFIDRSEIRGRVFLRYWPLNRFSLIKSPAYE